MIKIGFRAIFYWRHFKIEVGDFLLKGKLLKIESVYFFKISLGNSRLRRNFLRSFRFFRDQGDFGRRLFFVGSLFYDLGSLFEIEAAFS